MKYREIFLIVHFSQTFADPHQRHTLKTKGFAYRPGRYIYNENSQAVVIEQFGAMHSYMQTLIDFVFKLAHLILSKIRTYHLVWQFIRHAHNQLATLLIGKCDYIPKDTLAAILGFRMFAAGKRIIMLRLFELNMVLSLTQCT